MSGRCKCCDTEMKARELKWYQNEMRHEELCVRCRARVAMEMRAMGWSIDYQHLPSTVEEDEENV